jgi:O-antigen/teichoic acid export membrane protein
VFRGTLWRVIGNSLPILHALTISVVAARVLGPAGMGRQSFIAFAELTVITIATGGLPVALTRYIGERIGRGEPEAVRRLLGWGWRVELVLAFLGAGILAIVGVLRVDLRAAWFLAAFTAGLSILHTIPTAVLMGLQRWRAATVIGLVTGTLGVGATVAVLMAGGGIAGMFAVEAVVVAINLGGAGILARRALGRLGLGLAGRQEDIIREVARYAANASILVVLTFVVWRRSEFFFLDRFSTAAHIAYYSIAFSMITALDAVTHAIATVVAPAFATLFGAGAMDRIRSGFGRGIRLLLLVSFVLTAAALAGGPTLLTLVYGTEYRAAGGVLLVLVVGLPLYSVRALSGALLGSLALVRRQVMVAAVAVAVNVGLDVLLIPRGGSLGAALASVGGQITSAALLVWSASRAMAGVQWNLGSLVRGAVAAAVAGAAAWTAVSLLGGAPGLALGALVGLVVYGILAWGLRILASDDAAWLSGVMGPRLGSLVARLSRGGSSREMDTSR